MTPSADFCPVVRRPPGPLSRCTATPSRSPGVSSIAFNAQPPNLRFASLMNMDFAMCCPLVRRWRLLFGSCSSARIFDPRFLQTPPRGGSPCVSLTLHLHQVGWKTSTSELLNMPGTQRSRWRGIGLVAEVEAPTTLLPLASVVLGNEQIVCTRINSDSNRQHLGTFNAR